MNHIHLKKVLKESSITFFLTLVTLGPLVAFKLQDYTVEVYLLRAARLGLFLAVLRALQLILVPYAAKLKASKAQVSFDGQRQAETHVSGNRAKALIAKWFFFLLGSVVIFLIPAYGGNYVLTVAITALIYVLLGLGLNIVVGLAGLLDLGFVAFYALGAYTYALGNQYFDLGFWGALPLAGIMAAFMGCVLAFPVLRMHGDYLAIVTLGFGEIIRLVLNNWIDFTGGPNGVKSPYPTLFGLEFTRSPRIEGGQTFHEFFGLEYSSDYRYIFIYAVLVVVVASVMLLVTRVKNMSIGRAWEALREDEIACRSLGINHVTVKLSAFAMGAGIGGMAGVLFAAYQGFINPSSFTFFESALILAIVVLGGLGSTPGVVFSAIVLTILPEALRHFSDYRVLVFGLLMATMMIWKPRGLVINKRPHIRKINLIKN